MDLSCTTDKYDALYARWLGNPGELLDLAGWKPGMTLLDLCGGTGAISREALCRGASPMDITVLDLNPRVEDIGVQQVQGKAEEVLPELDVAFDVVICRQAFAYLDLEDPRALPRWSPGIRFMTAVRGLLKPQGRLVFNTFRHPKSRLKSYKHEGRRYVEGALVLGRTVWHLQWAWGIGWDVSRFAWYTEQEIRNLLHRFLVREHHSESSLRWVCVR